jgi:hypothetical protein
LCGARIWQDSVSPAMRVLFQIDDPNQMFSTSYRGAIRAAATAWTRESAGFVTIQECNGPCPPGRFVSVVPGDGDGLVNPDDPAPQLPMPVSGSGRVSPHRIAHQWGHVVGLSHTYERADRDRYMGFDPELWCPASGGAGLPARCAAGPAGQEGLPAITTGTFGVFDEKSKMNGFHRDGICGADEPDDDSGEPTIGDVSAAAELFFGTRAKWSPFRPIGRSVSADQPLDYQLATDVDPVGSPAIAAIDYASPEIFVRGTDDRVYGTSRKDLLTADWQPWTMVAEETDNDPAVVFARNATDTLFLAIRSKHDGQILLSARRAGAWGLWTSLGAPPAGAASAPALASESPYVLAVFVRGGDGLIYRLACTDADEDCTTSASLPDAWTALPAPPSGTFVGKPAAVWLLDSYGLTVAAVRDDRTVLMLTNVNTVKGEWQSAGNINADLGPTEREPGVAITPSDTPADPVFFARNQRGLLVSDTRLQTFFPIGGVLASAPAAVGLYHQTVRTDVAAIILDHGRPSVWWRYSDGKHVPPCTRPGSCGTCVVP